MEAEDAEDEDEGILNLGFCSFQVVFFLLALNVFFQAEESTGTRELKFALLD